MDNDREWRTETVQRIEQELSQQVRYASLIAITTLSCAMLSIHDCGRRDELPLRVAWRDQQLLALAKHLDAQPAWHSSEPRTSDQ